MPYFDAHLIAPGQPDQTQPPGLAGAILYGPGAAAQQRVCSAWQARGRWLHAEQRGLTPISGSLEIGCLSPLPPGVIDLQLPDENALLSRLKKPAPEWWPLAAGAAANGQFLRLNLPPGATTAACVRKLAQRFPRTRFLLDPFRHGPVAGWQAQVRLAECGNVWLTSLGLLPGAACRWEQRGLTPISGCLEIGCLSPLVEEAFYFTAGEVGAGRLLLATGARWEDLLSASFAAEWLAGIRCLDKDQRALILGLNARELFGEGFAPA